MHSRQEDMHDIDRMEPHEDINCRDRYQRDISGVLEKSSSAPNPTLLLDSNPNMFEPVHDKTIVGNESDYSECSHLDLNVTVFDDVPAVGRQYNRSVSEPPVRPTHLEGRSSTRVD